MNFTQKAVRMEGQIFESNVALWVSPNDPDFIVTGGFHLYKSTNGGDDFTRISDGYILTVQPHVDQHCIVSDPDYGNNGNKRVYVCGDGGVYRTDDITTASYTSGTNESRGWERKDFNYQTTQFYGVAGNGTTGLIYGGTQDNGSLRLLSGSQNANLVEGGDGAVVAVDPTDHNYCYGSYFYLTIHRSTVCSSLPPGSSTKGIWQGVIGENEEIIGRIADVTTRGFVNFIAPFILDPNQHNRMLAGGRSLWRTNDVRASDPIWAPISNPFLSNINAIAVATGNSNSSNIIWVGLNDGSVYKTVNGLAASPTWIPIDNNTGTTDPFQGGQVTRILIDKNNPDIVYVAFGGFTNGNLQRTYNGGTNWIDITGAGLPDVPIRAIAHHPNNSNKLYIGTEIGIFRSENIGTTWGAVLDGPANVPVQELVYMSNSTTLLAATYGRGIWTSNEEALPSRRTLFDFDGDARADPSVFRPSNATWYLDRSLAGFQAVQWGATGDKVVAGDYDSDGKADITVWRPSTGNWLRLNSSNGTFVSVQWGQQGDVPVPADFDGDNKTDEAVFRPSAGIWYLNRSTTGYTSVSLGESTDLPSAADFDGDGKADQAVFRPSNGVWYLMQSINGAQNVPFGQSGDIPVAADYDGDGKADVAVFRGATWYVNGSSSGFSSTPWGSSTDKPVPADYDGDGKADVAVWRPADGVWHLLQSANGYRSVHFGSNGDIPIPKP